MTTQESNAAPDIPAPAWGAPAAERNPQPWSVRRIVVSAVVAVVIVAGGTAAVVVATNHGSGSAGSGFGGPGGPGAGPGGGGGFRGGPGSAGVPGGVGPAGALHGDFVASNGNGGYQTERLQTGRVTAVSATAITLRSADGYTQTYVINSATSVDRGGDTIADVTAGNTVTVVATLAGDQATATTLDDRTLEQDTGAGPNPAGGNGNGNGNGNGGGGTSGGSGNSGTGGSGN